MPNRDRAIDILRGIGIVLMIAGHIGIGKEPYEGYFSWWYHAFHMPIFYIISGYFFDRRCTDIQSFIYRKAKTLLVPYVFWGIFHIGYNHIMLRDVAVLGEEIQHFFVDPTIGQVPIAGALWFLPALFWMEIMYFHVNALFKSTWAKYVVSLIIGLCGMLAVQNEIHLPFAMDAALVGVAFVGTGALIREISQKKAIEQFLGMKGYVFVILCVLANILIFSNSEVNFRSGIYGNYALAYINGVLPTILLWNLARIMDMKIIDGKIKIITNALSTVGRDSIIYVCLNQWMIKHVMPAFTSVGNSRFLWQLIARGMTLMFVCFVCNTVMKVMVQSNHLKHFVGKK